MIVSPHSSTTPSCLDLNNATDGRSLVTMAFMYVCSAFIHYVFVTF